MSLHLAAKPGDIAPTVLLPGDPLRAKFLAENMLENASCYNEVRGMYGFTGTYKGKKVSVQGTGMGIPSIGIYVNELLREYGCQKLIRIGTCGSILPQLQLGEMVLGAAASTDSSINRRYFDGMDYAPYAHPELLAEARKIAQQQSLPIYTGGIFSTDNFYDDFPNRWEKWARHGIFCVDMESSMLYTLAARYGAQALAILTVSDHIPSGGTASHQDREKAFTNMMTLALEIA